MRLCSHNGPSPKRKLEQPAMEALQIKVYVIDDDDKDKDED